MKTHRDVVIATPGSSMKSAYVKSLIHTIKMLEDKNISWSFASEYSSYVPYAREATVLADSVVMDESSGFEPKPILQGISYNKIFWIDSDISWTPEDFLELYESREPIISGVYAADEKGKLCAFYLDEDEIPRWHTKQNFLRYVAEGQEVIETWAVGFGFLCVAAGVFEKMDRPYFNIENIDWSGNPTYVGEDLSWCINAKRNGHRVMVNRTVRVTHHKESGLSL